MASRFTNDERQVLTAVEELLWTEWDPIGCGVPRDEYDSYAIQAYGRAKRGEDAEQIAKYLTEVETQAMGLTPHSGDQDRNLAVAKRVTEIVKQGAGS